MNNFIFRFFLSIVCLASIFTAVSSTIIAAPVKINRVVQIVSAKPGKAATGSFSQLRLIDGPPDGDNDDKKSDDANKTAAPQTQDDRVIVETTTEIVQDEDCNCADVPKVGGGFPKLALLGLGAIPLVFLFRDKKSPTPTPTSSVPPSDSPTPPTSPTPTDSPTPPPTTPTPPEPVPEPMTILLFGTGLAGIGVAARKRFGKKGNQDQE